MNLAKRCPSHIKERECQKNLAKRCPSHGKGTFTMRKLKERYQKLIKEENGGTMEFAVQCLSTVQEKDGLREGSASTTEPSRENP